MCKVLSGALNTSTHLNSILKLISKAWAVFFYFGNKDLKVLEGGQSRPRTPESWLITWQAPYSHHLVQTSRGWNTACSIFSVSWLGAAFS